MADCVASHQLRIDAMIDLSSISCDVIHAIPLLPSPPNKSTVVLSHYQCDIITHVQEVTYIHVCDILHCTCTHVLLPVLQYCIHVLCIDTCTQLLIVVSTDQLMWWTEQVVGGIVDEVHTRWAVQVCKPVQLVGKIGQPWPYHKDKRNEERGTGPREGKGRRRWREGRSEGRKERRSIVCKHTQPYRIAAGCPADWGSSLLSSEQSPA